MKIKWLHKTVLLAMSTLLFAGCSSSPVKEAEKPSSLKVMFSDERYFFQEYGDLFAMKYPNIEIQVASSNYIYNGEVKDYKKAFDEFIEKEQPDVILLNQGNFEEYALNGKLAELDTLIQRDKYNTENLYPALLEQLKEQGGGKLYGLAPTFYGNAILYNADLFKKYGVEIPRDGIGWQEMLDLARRFPSDGDEKSRVYGFGRQYSMQVDSLAQSIASTAGLKDINTDTLKVTVNTDSWKKAYQMAIDAIESKAIYNTKNEFNGGSTEEYYKSQPFLMGRMAMTIGSPYELQNIKEAKNAIKDYKPFELGIVAGPVDPATPDIDRSMGVADIFAIRANSANTDAAWEFIKFINGDEFAKVKSRTMNSGLLTRMGYSTEFDGHSLEAFYKLKPGMDSSGWYDGEKIPNEFYQPYHQLLEKEIGLVVDKKKSLDEALKTIQEQGQAALDKAVKDKAAKKETDSTK